LLAMPLLDVPTFERTGICGEGGRVIDLKTCVKLAKSMAKCLEG